MASPLAPREPGDLGAGAPRRPAPAPAFAVIFPTLSTTSPLAAPSLVCAPDCPSRLPPPSLTPLPLMKLPGREFVCKRCSSVTSTLRPCQVLSPLLPSVYLDHPLPRPPFHPYVRFNSSLVPPHGSPWASPATRVRIGVFCAPVANQNVASFLDACGYVTPQVFSRDK
jgi:hypothetical protein